MFETDKLMFLHVEKTGGGNIRFLLEKVLTEEISQDYSHIPPKEFDGRFVLMSVREPLQTYVSMWSFAVQLKAGGDYQPPKEFQEKYYHVELDNIEIFREWLVVYINKFGPVYQNRVMRQCLGQPENVDGLIHAETMKEDLLKILPKTGSVLVDDWKDIIEKNIERRINKTNHLPWEEYYTPRLRKLVKTTNSRIYELYYGGD